MDKAGLRLMFEAAADAYKDALIAVWGLRGTGCWWVAGDVGGLLCFDDWSIGLDDMIYCVDNDVSYEEYVAWQDYCVRSHEYGLDMMNLDAWHKGAPRIPEESFDRLDKLKRELEDAIEKAKR
ncbi:MAG: hypothetical protein IJ729_04315 [Alloprevotella sp.]|nr:hypothetical protein [Alloprevotella sp.]